ncbi:hypothetical protein F4604DRAFT_1676288 [Suillus subluteus]|nr:hypothetical protein F4604DRAFT_1676288 [Suillus subluteus]
MFEVIGSDGSISPRPATFPTRQFNAWLNTTVPYYLSLLSNHSNPRAHPNFNPERIDVYKYLTVLSPARPHISNSKCCFKTRASPVVASNDARFDTALFIEQRALYTGKGILVGQRGRVKVSMHRNVKEPKGNNKTDLK